MDIVGNGQLAKVFKKVTINDTLLFASGVSDSNCKNELEFKREEDLLKKKLKQSQNKKFIYFSSCALSADNYELNDYYRHKIRMEKIIQETSDDYYIFRLPQLFGSLTKHPTLINFIYDSIVNKKQFNVFDDAYRYVIEIEDVQKLVISYLEFSEKNIIVDLANPYRYKIIDIVRLFEKLLDKKALFKSISKSDKYTLDLKNLELFVKKYNLNFYFGKDYLEYRLKEKICAIK